MRTNDLLWAVYDLSIVDAHKKNLIGVKSKLDALEASFFGHSATAPLNESGDEDAHELLVEQRRSRWISQAQKSIYGYAHSDGVSRFNIHDTILNREDLMSLYFGLPTYEGITAMIRRFLSEDSPDKLIINIDSFGGLAAGNDAPCDLIYENRDKIEVHISGNCCSAAYFIASQAGVIRSLNKAACIGSVGCAISYYVPDDVVDISSSNAPDKRPDPKTEEGKEVVRTQIDQLESVFLSFVSRGREKDVTYITKNFGAGGFLAPQEALSVGMIDAIGYPLADEVNTNREDSMSVDNKNSAADLENAANSAASAAVSRVREIQSAGKSKGLMSLADAVAFETSMTLEQATEVFSAAEKDIEDAKKSVSNSGESPKVKPSSPVASLHAALESPDNNPAVAPDAEAANNALSASGASGDDEFMLAFKQRANYHSKGSVK